MTDVRTLIVAEIESDLRLDRWFHRHFPAIGHGLLEKLLRTGQIRVDGKRVKANHRLEPGQTVRVPPLPDTPAPAHRISAPVDEKTARMLRDCVLYCDDEILAINKPPGLAVQGGTGIADNHLDAMLDALILDAAERPRLVHRLDKDTSGVLLLGRTAAAAAKLAAAFKSRSARKCYWALVVGVPRPLMGRIDAPLAKLGGPGAEKVTVDSDDGRHAVTYYRVVESTLKRAAWLELEPRTGRTHQLRAHCLLLGTPILGDGKYGGKEAVIEGAGISRKLHLHSRAVRLPHPKTGQPIEITAPLPRHFIDGFASFGFSERSAGPPFLAFDTP